MYFVFRRSFIMQENRIKIKKSIFNKCTCNRVNIILSKTLLIIMLTRKKITPSIIAAMNLLPKV
jgi:hypothetical protein